MTRLSTLLSTAALVVMPALSSPVAAAEENLGKEGVFTMIVVKDGPKFNRCVMHQGQGANILRIASSKAGSYAMSIPTAGQNRTAPFTIFVDGKSGIVVPIGGQDPGRTSTTLTREIVDVIKAGKKTIDVELGTVKFSWRLNGDMKGSFIVLDSCVEGYRNGA